MMLVDMGTVRSIFPASREDLKQESDLAAFLTAADGSPILSYGTRPLSISILGRRYSWDFVIVDVRDPALRGFPAHLGLAVDIGRKRLLDTDSCQSLPLATGPKAPTTCSATPHQYAQLLTEFPEAFKPELHQVTRAPAKHGIYHHIKKKGPPAHARFRRLPPQRLQEAKNAFAEMERMGICKKASSHGRPPHGAEKPDGSWRPLRQTTGGLTSERNLTITPAEHAGPNGLSFHKAKIFTKLDLLKPYFQVPSRAEDIPKTAIIMPFGPMCSPSPPFSPEERRSDFPAAHGTASWET
ncbi:uncharacterized protein [Macrobrachium rosenbergii]|uniref:uncharacterized protein n=1 Tax=Macrobrachium rosenbergii TaxID=79674 RepID=UPI0034D74BE3